MTRSRSTAAGSPGFTLLELMLSLSLGALLFALMLRLIGADLQLGRAMALRLSESSRQRRSLELIREELGSAHGWMVDPPVSNRWPCRMNGRRPVLAIATQQADAQARADRAIVYSVGSAPDAIWRGEVLMRCGPAYSLDGVPNLRGAFQNRVLLDALPNDIGSGFTARPHPQWPVLQLEVEQQLPSSSGAPRSLRSRLAA
ncbi:prepilin-type N-terminal cleavage/methylation domain-containing protein [Synechococcus sp. MIT S9503]|uniref:prepilin-type N-terminal cleavage/methylation domain-containing protein n=1 Tax=Synechococcus sp. MIT S9503 TaxID=3082547 RepID=UPI0039A70BB6